MTSQDGSVRRTGENVSGVSPASEPEAIDTGTARDGSSQDAITAAADEFDAVVAGEPAPSLVTFVFGMRAEQDA